MEQPKYSVLTNEEAFAVIMAKLELADLKSRLAADAPRSYWTAVTAITTVCVSIMTLMMVAAGVHVQVVCTVAVLVAVVFLGVAMLVRWDDQKERKRAQQLERGLEALDNVMT